MIDNEQLLDVVTFYSILDALLPEFAYLYHPFPPSTSLQIVCTGIKMISFMSSRLLFDQVIELLWCGWCTRRVYHARCDEGLAHPHVQLCSIDRSNGYMAKWSDPQKIGDIIKLDCAGELM